MRIAIPVMNGQLSEHFGHCERFAIIEVDHDSGQIQKSEFVEPPEHQPGVLPKWLAGMQVQVIIAGGMGRRAQSLFSQNNIKVVYGASTAEPEELARQYVGGQLVVGPNVCDH